MSHTGTFLSRTLLYSDIHGFFYFMIDTTSIFFVGIDIKKTIYCEKKIIEKKTLPTLNSN